MAKLEATVQYGDWKGRVAADGADKRDIHDFFRQMSPDAGMLVAWHVYVSEGGKPSLRGLFVAAPSMDAAASILDTAKPVPVNVVETDLSADEFFKLFKRFSLTGFKRNSVDLENTDFDGWVN